MSEYRDAHMPAQPNKRVLPEPTIWCSHCDQVRPQAGGGMFLIGNTEVLLCAACRKALGITMDAEVTI